MKRLWAILMSILIAVSMAACGNEVPQDQSSSADGTDSASMGDNETEKGENPQTLPADDGEINQDGQQEPIEDDIVEDSVEEQGSHILVAYFSRVGNTDWEDGVDAVTSASLNVEDGKFVGNAEYLARMAQEVTGGDLFLIQTEETYPSDYRETTNVAAEEQGDNARPALASHVENMDQYDIVVLIFPNWWGTLPQPLFTFLEEYDFSGKTILPLCTHEGSRMGSSERAIAELCPDAVLLEGLSVRGSNAASAQADVEKWIINSGILD